MKSAISILLIFLSFFIGTSQVIISSNKSPTANFKSYKTFKVLGLDIKSVPEFEPQKESLNFLIEEVAKQMETRGYEKVSENPDLILNLGVVITQEQKTAETSIRDAPRYMGQRNYHWESETYVVQDFKAGTLTLDVVDSSLNQMVWQATTKSMIKTGPQETYKNITKTVKKLFKRYPGKVKK
ncbi:DUF4136 domain-containing protein [Eudoraea sp.]|uniref:DUF4136 domain-containing protein n=1 Tax=Eudoraea sp. TaxID=1979955 RepID=UPI003C708150